MFYLWLMIVILLAAVEVMTVNLTTIWFVVSGLVALLLSFITDNFFIQLAVFVILGVVLLITTRPLLSKFLHRSDVKTNVDRIVGMKGIITETVSKNHSGEVKVDGKYWTAIANQEFKVDSIVKILEIDGVKLKVDKWED